ncbi:uncharacterized protein LOC123555950 [Mercenaria mercenaria]|uniref:uncharacterized protein LOC123555950 n=1 Tax=Mercenaria mercenaria TaxID=6596 RepID=UPI00234EEE0B|nr:uncharacterized protein LOC123555950 [Mercenaria mercenaria]
MTENDFYCDLCLREDVKKRGIVYCYNCLEILCKECERHHKKNKASISHKLIDISRDAIEWNTKDYDYYERHSKCTKHRLKYVKFLCKTHDEFCCEKCVQTEHKKCKLVDEVYLNAEIKQTLENMEQTADKLIKHESNYRSKLDAEEEEGRWRLENLKEHIDYSYEKFKSIILTETLVRRRYLSSASLLQTASVEKLKAEIRSSSEVVENATIQNKLPSFLLLREVQQELQEYEEKLIQFKRKASSVTVPVVETASVQDIFKEVDKFVRVEETPLEPTCFEMLLPHNPQKDTVEKTLYVRKEYP